MEKISGVKATHRAAGVVKTAPDANECPSGVSEGVGPDFKTAVGGFSTTLHITAAKTDKDAKTFGAKHMRYLAKGIDPSDSIRLTNGARISLADWVGIDHLADQGVIRGKRCGYSVFSLGGRQWKSWAVDNQVSTDLFAYRFRTFGPLDDESLDALAQTLRLKT